MLRLVSADAVKEIICKYMTIIYFAVLLAVLIVFGILIHLCVDGSVADVLTFALVAIACVVLFFCKYRYLIVCYFIC